MFFRRKNTAPISPMPPWMKWGLLAFLVFAVLTHERSPRLPAPEGAGMGAPPHSVPRPVIGDIAVPGVASYRALLFPGSTRPSLDEIQEGQGEAAFCGQEVEVVAQSAPFSNVRDAKEADKNETLRFRLGADSGHRGLSEAVLGMRPGGVRRAVIPGEKGLEDARVYTLTLKNAAPPAPQTPPDGLDFTAFETLPGRADGLPAACGDAVRLRVDAWGGDGKALMRNEEIEVVLGGEGVPAGLTRGALGMTPGAERLLILPKNWREPSHSALQTTVQNGGIATSLAWPETGVVIARVARIAPVSTPETQTQPQTETPPDASPQKPQP